MVILISSWIEDYFNISVSIVRDWGVVACQHSAWLRFGGLFQVAYSFSGRVLALLVQTRTYFTGNNFDHRQERLGLSLLIRDIEHWLPQPISSFWMIFFWKEYMYTCRCYKQCKYIGINISNGQLMQRCVSSFFKPKTSMMDSTTNMTSLCNMTSYFENIFYKIQMVSIIRCCNQYQLNKKHITGKENSCLNAKKVFRSFSK